MNPASGAPTRPVLTQTQSQPLLQSNGMVKPESAGTATAGSTEAANRLAALELAVRKADAEAKVQQQAKAAASKTEEKKAEDKKAEEKKADEKKAEDKKAEDKKAEDKHKPAAAPAPAFGGSNNPAMMGRGYGLMSGMYAAFNWALRLDANCLLSLGWAEWVHMEWAGWAWAWAVR